MHKNIGVATIPPIEWPIRKIFKSGYRALTKVFIKILIYFCAFFLYHQYNIPLIYINNITILQYSSCVLMLVFARWPFGHSGVRYGLCGCLTVAPIYFSVHNTHYTRLP